MYLLLVIKVFRKSAKLDKKSHSRIVHFGNKKRLLKSLWKTKFLQNLRNSTPNMNKKRSRAAIFSVKAAQKW